MMASPVQSLIAPRAFQDVGFLASAFESIQEDASETLSVVSAALVRQRPREPEHPAYHVCDVEGVVRRGSRAEVVCSTHRAPGTVVE